MYAYKPADCVIHSGLNNNTLNYIVHILKSVTYMNENEIRVLYIRKENSASQTKKNLKTFIQVSNCEHSDTETIQVGSCIC